MLRWLTRLAVGALVVALLVWLWTHYNEDLEEEELEEEIPLEFDVSPNDSATLSPVSSNSTSTDGTAQGAADNMAQTSSTAPDIDTFLADKTPATSENADFIEDAGVDAINAPNDEIDAFASEVAPMGEDATDEDAELGVTPTVGPRSKGEQEGYNPDGHDDELEAPPPGAGDNLIAIKGIGPKYGAQLAELGITTFGALIDTSIDTLITAFPRVTEAELAHWIEQARELSEQNS